MSDPNAEPQTISETRHKARRLAVDLDKLTGRAYIDRIESELMEAEERGRKHADDLLALINKAVNGDFGAIPSPFAEEARKVIEGIEKKNVE
jgi:hypothetical protein